MKKQQIFFLFDVMLIALKKNFTGQMRFFLNRFEINGEFIRDTIIKILKVILSKIQYHCIQICIYCFRLDLSMQLPQAGSIGASTQASQEQDELTQRLARLRQAE